MSSSPIQNPLYASPIPTSETLSKNPGMLAASSTTVSKEVTTIEAKSTNKAAKVAFAIATVVTVALAALAAASGFGLLALPIALPLAIPAWAALAGAAGLTSIGAIVSGFFAFKKPASTEAAASSKEAAPAKRSVEEFFKS